MAQSLRIDLLKWKATLFGVFKSSVQAHVGNRTQTYGRRKVKNTGTTTGDDWFVPSTGIANKRQVLYFSMVAYLNVC
ncbi:hypothetical protein IEO21_06104 [Rhodonia placenta]|uniref:Uncharacterized protein n=1 Tax=Rhodonia placenta TaxID=104341 RepID=A0A8H7P0P2_9APHY|nr:hypothetical protein IEO21_06104 [Postia placenta]